MTGSLNCPNCGASVPGVDATRCEYCHSALTAIACPSCLGPIFAGMQFCPHCGAKSARAVNDDGSISCPDCKTPMRRVHVGTSDFVECPDCGGTWVDADTFTRLCTDREARGAVAETVGTARPNVPAPRESRVHYRKCPICGTIMNRQNFGRRSGIIMDICKGHGLWLEHRELQAALSFIDHGGLERARRLDEEQKEEQRKLMEDLDALLRRE